MRLREKNVEEPGFFYTKHYPQIKHYIASRINSVADAEDLTQDVFVEFYRSNDYQNPETYLFGIARNTIHRYHRKKANSLETIPLEFINKVTASYQIRKIQDSLRQILPKERKRIIQHVLGLLPPKAQEAVRLRFVEGLAPKEAAQKARCPVHTFCQRLHDAKNTIQKLKDR